MSRMNHKSKAMDGGVGINLGVDLLNLRSYRIGEWDFKVDKMDYDANAEELNIRQGDDYDGPISEFQYWQRYYKLQKEGYKKNYGR